MPVPEIKPHAEIQREAQVSGDLQDMVWGQPDLGLGIEESEEIEAGWSDADFLCNVDADLLCGQCGLAEGDPGVPAARASPVQKDLQASPGGHGLSSIAIRPAVPGGGTPVAQRHAFDSWLGRQSGQTDQGTNVGSLRVNSGKSLSHIGPQFSHRKMKMRRALP